MVMEDMAEFGDMLAGEISRDELLQALRAAKVIRVRLRRLRGAVVAPA